MWWHPLIMKVVVSLTQSTRLHFCPLLFYLLFQALNVSELSFLFLRCLLTLSLVQSFGAWLAHARFIENTKTNLPWKIETIELLVEDCGTLLIFRGVIGLG